MRHGLIAAALAVLLASCGGGGSSSSGGGNESTADGRQAGDGAGKPDNPAKKSPVTDTRFPELFIDGWYRAPGGGATVQFPELPQGWELSYSDSAAGRVVTARGRGAMATFTFVPDSVEGVKAEDLPLAQGLAAAVVKKLTAEAPHLKPTRAQPDIPHNGGFAAAQLLEGKAADNSDEMAMAAVVARGREVVLCLCRAAKAQFDQAWQKFAGPAFESARVGDKVPRLQDHDPGVRLSGVYEGPTDFDFSNAANNRYRFLTFHPGGWYHELIPRSELELDCEALYQFNPGKLKRYKVSPGKIEWLTADGKPDGHWPVEIFDDRLVFQGKHKWFKVSRTGNLKLEGAYDASTYYVNSGYGSTFTFSSSKTYFFTKEGKFSFESFAAARSADDSSFPSADGFRSWASAHSQTPVSHGSYRVEGNLLLLAFADGRRARKVITLSEGKDAGLLFIGGNPYLAR